MNDAAPVKAPTHLWIVGIVSLLWNCVGAYDYTMSKLENMDYLSMMSDDPAKVQEMIDFMNNTPLWANIGWGLGVWGALLGSILLLMRNRHAVTVFLLSLAGVIISMIYQYTTPNLPAVMSEGPASYMMWGILAIAIGLFLYARSMAAKGVLK